MKELPPERKQELKGKFKEWRGLPPGECEKEMMRWPFYRNLPPGERKIIRKFILAGPPAGHPSQDGRGRWRENIPPPGPRFPGD
jgi:hypothetical protein